MTDLQAMLSSWSAEISAELDEWLKNLTTLTADHEAATAGDCAAELAKHDMQSLIRARLTDASPGMVRESPEPALSLRVSDFIKQCDFARAERVRLGNQVAEARRRIASLERAQVQIERLLGAIVVEDAA